MKRFFIDYILSTFNYKGVIRDYRNYKFIKEQIKENENHRIFKKYDIFINWWNHLCILISLNKDEIEMTEGQPILEDGIFYDKLNELNNFITNVMLLGDLLVPYVKKILGTYSYKLVYKPYFNVYSIWWVLRNIIFYSGLLVGGYLCL